MFSIACWEMGGFVVEHALETNTEKLHSCAYRYKYIRSNIQKIYHPWLAQSNLDNYMFINFPITEYTAQPTHPYPARHTCLIYQYGEV